LATVKKVEHKQDGVDGSFSIVKKPSYNQAKATLDSARQVAGISMIIKNLETAGISQDNSKNSVMDLDKIVEEDDKTAGEENLTDQKVSKKSMF